MKFKKVLALLLAAVLTGGVIAGCSSDGTEDTTTTAGETTEDTGGTTEGSGEATDPAGDAEFHIGIVTGTVSQSEDDLRGAEELIRLYGSSDDGGMITHLTYPDNFMTEMETTISQIAGLADDPLMKVVVVNQSVPGTAAAFAKIRETRDDIILLAGTAQEDPDTIDPVADIVVDTDNISRGYLIPLAAQKMGADTLVHVSFPRHMSYELLSRRRAIMKEAAADLGMTFADETAPDPTSDVGVPGAQQFILEHMADWVAKYGENTAFFATNDAQTEPMLQQVAALGAYFVEADLPSPLMGYPGAFGLDLSAEAGDWPAILSKVEQTVVDAGASGHMGTWAYSYGFTSSVALGEYGKQVVEGTMELGNVDDLLAAFEMYTPGAAWNGSLYLNADGETIDNHLLVYQDTYVLGEGYLNMTDEVVPEKYYSITAEEVVYE